MPKDVHPIMKRYIPIVRGIAGTFGSNCEVVLHDFSGYGVDYTGSIQ